MDAYRLSPAAAYDALHVTSRGLTASAAAERTRTYGKNEFPIREPITFAKLLLRQLRSFVTWLLIGITVFALGTGILLDSSEQLVNAVIIGFIVVVNALVGAYQDYKAERTAVLLRDLLTTQATVLRDGVSTVLPSTELVPGDTITLAEGDRVPADCRLVTVESLRVSESLLTGESHEVEKSVALIAKDASLADRVNMVFMNTFVTSGSATALVVATGAATEVGKIAAGLDPEKPSPFVQEVDDAARAITLVALALILVVSVFLFLEGFHWVQIFMIACALVVGSIPEGLPAIVTFALAAATARLASRKVLVKRKSLLETLGSIDVICTDKTGTLTQNRMTVKRLYVDGAFITNFTARPSTPSFESLHAAALLANEAVNTNKGFTGAAEDLALIDLANTMGTDIIAFKQQFIVRTLEPFSSATKSAGAVVRKGRKTIRYRKGAPEVILASCGYEQRGRKRVALTRARRAAIARLIRECEEGAFRVLAFSVGGVRGSQTFLGFVGLYDPPHYGIQGVVAALYDANIDIKMITGDTVHTGIAIAKECGFQDIHAIGWEELKDLSEQELSDVVQTHNVFGRMSPEYKVRIVTALERAGKRVAITGDGVNDAPALSEATVGIAMGGGADIAKESADLVLLDNGLDHIVEGVSAGRTVFANIRKVLNYLLTTNVAEVFVVFFAALLGAVPFTAIQLLWVNFVTDVAPAMGLGVDPAAPDVLRRKPTGSAERIIDRSLVTLTILVSAVKVAVLLGIFFLTRHFTGDTVLAQTMTFTWLVLSHLVRIATLRFAEGMPLTANPVVTWAVVVPVILQLLILYTPLAGVFGVVPLGATAWLVLGALVLLSIAAARLIAFVPRSRAVPA